MVRSTTDTYWVSIVCPATVLGAGNFGISNSLQKREVKAFLVCLLAGWQVSWRAAFVGSRFLDRTAPPFLVASREGRREGIKLRLFNLEKRVRELRF